MNLLLTLASCLTPKYAASDSFGNIFVPCSGSNFVARFSYLGSNTWSNGEILPSSEKCTAVSSVAIDKYNNIYAAI